MGSNSMPEMMMLLPIERPPGGGEGGGRESGGEGGGDWEGRGGEGEAGRVEVERGKGDMRIVEAGGESGGRGGGGVGREGGGLEREGGGVDGAEAEGEALVRSLGSEACSMYCIEYYCQLSR